MWTLEQLQDRDLATVEINGKWVPARPENFKRYLVTINKRISNAWEVFMCRAEAFTWPEGQ